MSVDKSLRIKNTLVRHRNVLTRAQRLEELERLGTWKEGDSPYGLPKVRVLQAKRGTKKKKKKEEEEPGPRPQPPFAH